MKTFVQYRMKYVKNTEKLNKENKTSFFAF